MSLNRDFFNRETNITAKVICDSISESGDRITTLEIEYPRFILAELNSHKALEKNSSSSRAIPIKTMIESIESNMATPLYWGSSKAGMQAGKEIENFAGFGQGLYQWCGAFKDVEKRVHVLSDQGYHKQIVNRLIEPFQMMKTVITGTDWDNFFNLRLHPDSQPEFCMLAYKMYKAMQESVPTLLKDGEWHLPYVESWRIKSPDENYFTPIRDKDGKQQFFTDDGDIDTFFTSEKTYLTLEEAQRVSASCSAQTSFRKSDDSLDKADKVFDMLINADVIHSSPFGHLATPITPIKVVEFNDGMYMKGNMLVNTSFHESWEKGITHMRSNGKLCSGNLTGFISYRHLIPNNTCWDFNFDERMKLFDN